MLFEKKRKEKKTGRLFDKQLDIKDLQIRKNFVQFLSTSKDLFNKRDRRKLPCEREITLFQNVQIFKKCATSTHLQEKKREKEKECVFVP